MWQGEINVGVNGGRHAAVIIRTAKVKIASTRETKYAYVLAISVNKRAMLIFFLSNSLDPGGEWVRNNGVLYFSLCLLRRASHIYTSVVRAAYNTRREYKVRRGVRARDSN